MSWASLVGWVLLPQIGGILGALASATQIKTWYEVRISIEEIVYKYRLFFNRNF
jgi:hypothetical protein